VNSVSLKGRTMVQHGIVKTQKSNHTKNHNKEKE